ncbi:hypothetical protein [Mycetohabitans endofungorum]|uniref:hypothetical protein n=1 Tax=Mycetohabitans endofungorum TaxID=417203 RepID=UPI002B055873|nr:hypothetical protein [Mycetohabitans endofungorum]
MKSALLEASDTGGVMRKYAPQPSHEDAPRRIDVLSDIVNIIFDSLCPLFLPATPYSLAGGVGRLVFEQGANNVQKAD